ncbi:MAG: tRNA adenosine(34) deaminase TadA [Pseudomonadota bacterium]|jgi:tRNA(adenine34) deaminase|nr:tRNA adenosine(34) deaminase TadA [Pseudomonadota bacterium]
MKQALTLARTAGEQGEVPVGAVLVAEDGAILAESGNLSIATNDPTGHAEICVLRAAGRKLGNYRLPDSTLYVTLEPCPMCAGALVHARIARIVFGAVDPRAGACGSVFDLVRSAQLNHQIEVVQGVLAEESGKLLRDFFIERR